MNKKLMTSAIFVLLMLALLATACGGASKTPTTTPTNAGTSDVASVTAKGSIVPVQYAHMSFGVGGTIAKVNVKENDKVKAGDVLAELDTKDLELQVQAAQDGLTVAQKSLTQITAPASAEDIASAQAAYASALATLNRAKNGPTAEELAILKANLEKAKAAVDQAQAGYDRAGGASNPYASMLPTTLALQQATLDYQIAQSNYDKAVKPDAATLAQAQSTVAQAKSTLDLKQKGARAEDVAVAQARVQQAQTGLDQAKAALAKAKLVAPFDGAVTDMATRVGETIQPGAPVMTFADLSDLRVETTDLDEFGAARVAVGQSANVIVNAFSNKTLTGKVVSIAQQSVTLATGDISYVVTVALDKQDPDLRWGMTVKVEFQK